MAAKREILNAQYLINEYLSGKPIGEILKRQGISDCLFARLLRDFGVRRRSVQEAKAMLAGTPRKPRIDLDEKAIDDLYQSGESELALARRFGVSRAVIARCLRNRGVKRRSRSEAETIKWALIKTIPGGVERQCASAWKAADSIDNDREERVIAGHHAGKSTLQLMIDEGCSRPNIKRILRKNGITGREIFAKASGIQYSLTGNSISPYERPIVDALIRYGHEPIHQYAIGPSNVDIAFPDARIAIEIERRYRNDSKSIRRERIENIIRSGWRIIIVYDPMKKGIANEAVAQKIIAVLDMIRSDPSIPGEYGVIGRHGENSPGVGFDLDYLSRIPGF